VSRGVLFVADLTPARLAWARLLSRFSGRRIIYLRRDIRLDGERGQQLLDRAKARAFSFEDCSNPDNGYYYGDKPGIATSVADRLAASACFRRCLPLYGEIPDHEPRLRVVLRSYVDQDCFDLTHMLAWLTGQDQPGPAWVLTPMGFIRREYLRASGLDIRPCPGSLMLGFGRLVAGLLSQPAKRFHPGRRPQPDTAGKPGTLPGLVRNPADFAAKVLFFPHQTVRYGGLFFKDQFYNPDPDSPFHPSQILHVELGALRQNQVSDELVDYHLAHDIHYTILPMPSGRRRLLSGLRALAEVTRHSGASLLAGQLGLTAFLIQCRARWQFRQYSATLSAFPAARVALIGYEILTPKLLYLALDAHGIRTVASQERFHAPVFYDNWNFILDTYLTGSRTISDIVSRSRFKQAGHCVPVGQVRTDLLVDCRRRYSRSEVAPEARSFDKLAVVFDPPGFIDPDVARMMYVANRHSNHVFFREIIALAVRFPDTLFILRSKDIKWTTIDAYGGIVKEIGATPNLRISRDYRTPAMQYRLAAVADLVIAKYTSIGDECLGMGIPVIFHDYTPILPSSAHHTYDYGGIPVFVHDFETLVRRAETVLERGHYLEPDKVTRLAELVNDGIADGRVRERIRRHLDGMLPPPEVR
jgi:hypothetical protein